MNEKVYWGIAGAVALLLIYAGVRLYEPILVALHILVCAILLLVVLLQSGRAADLAGAFGGGGSQTAFGPRGATTFLSKATSFLAVVFMVTSLALAVFSNASRSHAVPTPAQQEQSQPAGEQPAEPQPAAPESAPAQTPPAESPPPQQ